jgi:protein-S-isoprenylcysteine O-methyltransferase Ste14
MTRSPEHALYWLWGGWYVSWLISLFWAGKPAAQPRLYTHFLYQLATMAGVILLFGPPIAGVAPYRLWTAGDRLGWWLFGLTAFAFAFCWWARLEMGRLWSGYISRLADHRVVDTGPFRIVRHPIYTGVIFAAFLLAIELGTLPALGGAAFFLLAFWQKARLEERFLRKELGSETYDAYRRRVPMLLPFGPKSA